MTSITTYSGLTPVGVYGYTNTNSNTTSNDFTHGNTSAAIAWGKDNCKVIIAARAGQTTADVYIRQYYTSWGNWYKLWHDGNDGSGSGLDADLLDGKHVSELFTGLSSNTTNKISITVGDTTKNITTLYASYLCSVGVVNPQTGRTQAYGNVYSYGTHSSAHEGAPTTYTSVIGFGRGTAGTVEICGEWTSGRGLWARALRDVNDDWYAWDRILTEATYKTVLDSRYLPTNYYWANVPISTTSSNTTTPTFGSVFINTGDATLKMYSGKKDSGSNDGNICLQTSIDNTDGETHSYPTQHGSRCNLILQPRGGQVYIGTNPDVGDTNYKLYVNGAIYGTSFAGSAKSISTISMTGGDGNTTGYRLMCTWSLSAWSNYRMVFAVASRHTGSGVVSIECSCNSATLSYANVTAQIHYFGNYGNVSVITSDAFQIFVSADGSKAYLFWKYYDYNTTAITPLLNATSLANGTWVTTIDTATYGTRKADTTVNPTGVFNTDTNSTFRLTFNSGHSLFSTAGIYCNPSTDSLYATHFYETSDIKFKYNIKNILTSDNIPQIKEFNWKSDGSIGYGLIAQELEEMGYSELVDDGGDHKTVNYSAALSLIVGKLQVKIKELEKEIENLKNKN